MPIPDYSDLKFTMADMERYFKDGNVQISDKNKAKLNTIFQKCDKKDEQGNKVKNGDGVLTGDERTNFLDKIKKSIPSLYDTVVDFFTIIDVKEDIEKRQQEMLKGLEEEERKFEESKKREIGTFKDEATAALEAQQGVMLERLEEAEEEWEAEKARLEAELASKKAKEEDTSDSDLSQLTQKHEQNRDVLNEMRIRRDMNLLQKLLPSLSGEVRMEALRKIREAESRLETLRIFRETEEALKEQDQRSNFKTKKTE